MSTTLGISPAGQVTRSGKTLIVPRGAILPPFCVKCGIPADGEPIKQKFRWHSPWWIALLVLGPLLWVIVAMINERMDLAVPLCNAHRNMPRGRRRTLLIIGVLLLAASLAAGIAFGRLFNSPYDGLLCVLLLMLMALVLLMLLRNALGNSLRPTHIDEIGGQFKNAGEDFLNKFPPAESIAEPTPSPGPLYTRWAWRHRIASLACVVPPWAMYVACLNDPCLGYAPIWLIFSLAWTVIYLIILFQAGFRGRASKGGLAWAAKTGISWTAIAIFGVIAAFAVPGLLPGILWAIFGLANGALAVSAVKTYRSLEPATPIWKIMWKKLGVFLACLFFGILWAGAVLDEAEGSRFAEINVSAIVSLRAINAAEGEYSSKYNRGYSPNLNALGPSSGSAQPGASTAGLIDSALASGMIKAYTFIYSPGPRDSSGHILSYTLSARCSCAKGNNYFTQESGVIRYTHENRPANAKDDPLYY